MKRLLAAACAISLTGGLVTAQEPEVTITKKVVSVDQDGEKKTRTYRRVIRDGKVIEESGDLDLLDDLPAEVQKALGRARRSKDGQPHSRTRRIIIKDGEIVDESDGDFDYDWSWDMDGVLDENTQKRIQEAMKKAGREMGKARVWTFPKKGGTVGIWKDKTGNVKTWDGFDFDVDMKAFPKKFDFKMEGLPKDFDKKIREQVQKALEDADVPVEGPELWLHRSQGRKSPEEIEEENDTEESLQALRERMKELQRKIDRLERQIEKSNEKRRPGRLRVRV